MNAVAHSVWEVKGKPVAVRLESAVTEGVLNEVMQGFHREPSFEVGGVLLGSAEQAGSKWIVTVTGFEPVACGYTRGSAWLLNGEEMANLMETVTRHPPGHVVGFYRSHMRNGLGMTEEDLLLFQRYFPEPWAVVLLVKPSTSRPPVGGFFLRERDRVRTESSYLEFPFAAAEFGLIPQAIAETADSVAYAEIEPPVQVEAPPRQSVWKLWQLGTLAGLVFGIGLLAGLWLAPKPAPGPDTDLYSLGLSATPAGDSSVHVAWNRNAAVIRAASGGALYIRDGQSVRAVEMDRTQLQTGSIAYRRQNPQVQFRLEVFAGDRITISELVNYPDR